MRRGRSTGNPTAAQRARFGHILEHGCIVCRKNYRLRRAAEIHHLTVGGHHGQRRLGHDFTIGLCSWHHRGVNAFGSVKLGRAAYGPSYALEPKAFRERFGNDDSLLAYQNQLIAKQEAA